MGASAMIVTARVKFEQRSRDPIKGEPVGFVTLTDRRAGGELEYGYQSLDYARRLAQQLGAELEQTVATYDEEES